MDNELRDQQQADQSNEANNTAWRDGLVGHQLVDLLEQNYCGDETT